jgi:hypothetical protein
MAKDNYGSDGQVENNPYCMDKSWQARNVKQMNQASGYHDMSDLANTKQPPTSMMGAKANEQEGPKAADNKYNYGK